jgi:hypothetical protein
LTAAAAALCGAWTYADQPAVSIEGGADLTGHNYEWIVTNNGRRAVTAVEFPHYRATLFFAPDGWRVECTNLQNVGVADASGVCRATAVDASSAVAPGRSGSFKMSASMATVPGGRSVIVSFGDGTTEQVGDVPVPQPEPLVQRYLPLIGLGVIAAAFALLRILARKKAPKSAPG